MGQRQLCEILLHGLRLRAVIGVQGQLQGIRMVDRHRMEHQQETIS